MNEQVERKKQMKKMESFVFNFHVSFLSYSPKIVQKNAFLRFCADLNKKCKSVKAIYIYASVKFLLSQHLFDILIANNSWMVAQTPVNHIIF